MATPALTLVPQLAPEAGAGKSLLVRSLPCLVKTILGDSQVHDWGSEEWQVVTEK